MTNIDIVSGFLGAGKTTFIKKLIADVLKDEKIVLIENEFGEIGIDGGFMKDAGIEVTEMNSGCICCTLVGDFAIALAKVIKEYSPDRVIIEPSGVGKLSDVVAAVRGMEGENDLTVNSRITVVDGKKAKLYIKNFGEFFNNQIESAATIVISRTQSMAEDKLAECVKLLKEHNNQAAIITTPWERLTGEMILDALEHGRDLEKELLAEHDHHEHGHDHHHDRREEEHHDHHHEAHCDCGHDHHHDHESHHHDHDHDHEGHHHDHDHEGHHHADEVFQSFGTQTVRRFARKDLEDILKLLSVTDNFGTVLRAKGIVEGDDGQWLEFDLVPEEIEIRNGKPDYTGRLCVIGTDLKIKELEALF